MVLAVARGGADGDSEPGGECLVDIGTSSTAYAELLAHAAHERGLAVARQSQHALER